MSFFPSSRRKYSSRNKGEQPTLSLTSMMDMMTILVLFLLKSYSAEGQLLNIPRDLPLPISSANIKPRPAVQILLFKDTLLVDGEPVAVDLPAIEAGTQMLIPPLQQQLQVLADQYQALAERNPNMPFKGDLILMADKGVRFDLLKKVLYTAGQAGFINQSLAVFEKGT